METNQLTPLTDDEAALLYHVQMHGSAGYPIERRGRTWRWRDWRGVRGAPAIFLSKKSAVAAFQDWIDLALARWSEMRAANPGAIMTAVGVVWR